MKTYVADAGAKGRGLFAAVDFEPGDVVDESHTIELEGPSSRGIPGPLVPYCFFTDDRCIVPFGLIAMCNEDERPNVVPRHEERKVLLVALRPIQRGEEILMHYSPTGLPEKDLDVRV